MCIRQVEGKELLSDTEKNCHEDRRQIRGEGVQKPGKESILRRELSPGANGATESGRTQMENVYFCEIVKS